MDDYILEKMALKYGFSEADLNALKAKIPQPEPRIDQVNTWKEIYLIEEPTVIEPAMQASEPVKEDLVVVEPASEPVKEDPVVVEPAITVIEVDVQCSQKQTLQRRMYYLR